MNLHAWKQQIIRAAADPDGDVMDSLARHLADCGEAKAILQQKGYLLRSIDAMVRDVPEKGL